VLSHEEARFPLVPTLRATLGVKGQRPVVGAWDNKDLVYSFAALKLMTGQLTTRLLDSPATGQRRTRRSKSARLQQAFAAHLRAIARAYPARPGKPVILTIANAPWHQAAAITEVLVLIPICSCIACRATVRSSTLWNASGACCAAGRRTIGSS
jgi:hypothetical protein